MNIAQPSPLLRLAKENSRSSSRSRILCCPRILASPTDPRRLGLSLHWLRLDLIEDTLSK